MKDPSPSGAVQPGGRTSAQRMRNRVLRYVLILVTVVIVIDTVVGERGVLAVFEARRDYENIEMDLARARAENAALRERARRLREDPSAIEELARRELGLMKPGEKVFIIRDVPPKH